MGQTHCGFDRLVQQLHPVVLLQHRCDAAFPLTDHADYPALLRYARESGASRIFTVHGFEEELAAALRKLGIRAEPLRETRQLELL